MSHTSTVSSVRAASTAATSAMASALTGSAASRARACSPSLGGAHGARLGQPVAQAAQRVAEPPGDGRVGRPLRRIDERRRVERDQPGWARHRPVAGVHAVEVAADGQQHVGPPDQLRHLGLVRRQPDRERVRGGRHAATAEARHHRRAQVLGQHRDRRLGVHRAAARPDDHPGVGEHGGGRVEIRLRGQRLEPGARRQRRDGLVAEHVGGDVHVDRPARVPHRRGDGFVQHACDLGGRAGREHRLGQRPEQARLVARLVQHTAEPARAAQRLWDLRRHEQHRRAGGRGLAERGQRVGRARPGGDDGGAEAPGGAGPAVGGVDGGLLVPDDQRRPLGHLPEREVVHPREPEDGGGAVHRDGVDDRPRNAPHAPSLTPPAAPVPRDGLAARGTITG